MGLPGSGKTTVARTLASHHEAVRFNPDEWMIDLGIDLYDESFRNRLEQRVIIEFGSWSRHERDQLLSLGRAAGAWVELHVLEPDVDEPWGRLAKRNVQTGETPVDRATLESGLAFWESPDESELNP